MELEQQRKNSNLTLLITVVTIGIGMSQVQHKLISLICNYDIKTIIGWQGGKRKSKRIRKRRKDKWGIATQEFASRDSCDKAFRQWYEDHDFYSFQCFGDKSSLNGYGAYTKGCLKQLKCLLYDLVNNPIYELSYRYNAMRVMDEIIKDC